MMKLSLWHKMKLLWRYGKDVDVAMKIHQKIHEHNYQKWKKEDWKAWLDAYRFNSNHPLAISLKKNNVLNPYIDIKDTSWKSCRKHMSKHIWKARSLKYTPNELPDCLKFEKSYLYINHLYSCIPYDYLDAIRGKSEAVDLLCSISRFSYEQLKINIDLQMYGVSSIDLGWIMFVLWSVKIAFEYNKQKYAFESFGCEHDDYKKLLDALKMTNLFDEQLKSNEFKKSISFFTKWYSAKHIITGTYSILASDENGDPRHGKDFSKSYKACVAFDEIMTDINEVMRFKFKMENRHGMEITEEEST